MRFPAPELQQRYRDEGFWLDRGLGEHLDGLLARSAGEEVRIWSDAHPYEGTFGEVQARARRFARALWRRGIGPGDVVSYQLPNRVEALVALFGTLFAGATVVPVVHFYGPKELTFILGQLGSRIHLTTAAPSGKGGVDELDALEGALGHVEEVVLVGEGARSWTTAFSDMAEDDPLVDLPTVDPLAPAVIGYTSGTTSDPKGVVHHSNSVLGELAQLARYDVGARLPMLSGAPLAHAMGLTAGVLLPLVRQQPAHILDRWVPDRVLAIMLEANLTFAGGSTFFLTSLLDSPAFTPAHARQINQAGLGGSPVPGAVGDRAEALGITSMRSYGSTEHPTSIGSDYFASPEHRKYTDGRELPGAEVRIVDEQGRDVGVGEIGELLTRGADLFAGYTDASLTVTAIDADGWFHTEDLGSRDADGYITIADRKKDIIIRGGENVSAAEVEEVLVRMPGVAEVAVVAAPDARLGEHTCAFYSSAPGAGPISLDAVISFFRDAGIAKQKWPEEVRPIADFPRTPSGKIKKQDLRQRLRDEAAPTST